MLHRYRSDDVMRIAPHAEGLACSSVCKQAGITANSGMDTLIGNSSSGADTFVVDNTGDTVSETNSGTAGLVESSVSFTLGAHVEKLTLTGTSNISGTGNSLTDTITGNTGNDVLTAGSGAAAMIGDSTYMIM